MGTPNSVLVPVSKYSRRVPKGTADNAKVSLPKRLSEPVQSPTAAKGYEDICTNHLWSQYKSDALLVRS